MHDVITFATEQAAAQLDQLDGEPVAAVFLVFDANGRCSAGSAVEPEYLPLLVHHIVEAAEGVRDDLLDQLQALNEAAGQFAGEAIRKARYTKPVR